MEYYRLVAGLIARNEGILRTTLAILIFLAALWRAALDWMATVALGDAWRFKSSGELWKEVWPNGPEVFETLIEGYLGDAVWAPLSAVLDVPLVANLCFVGAFIWMVRRPKGTARRSFFK